MKSERVVPESRVFIASLGLKGLEIVFLPESGQVISRLRAVRVEEELGQEPGAGVPREEGGYHPF